LLVTAASENYASRQVIVELAAQMRLIAIYPFEDYVKLGGLAAYAVDLGDIGVRAAGYVDAILRGAKPGDLPYQLPTRLRMVINLKTAKALDLTLPASLLARADEVIE
jgi:putative ABC transport system substrate-binding protein